MDNTLVVLSNSYLLFWTYSLSRHNSLVCSLIQYWTSSQITLEHSLVMHLSLIVYLLIKTLCILDYSPYSISSSILLILLLLFPSQSALLLYSSIIDLSSLSVVIHLMILSLSSLKTLLNIHSDPNLDSLSIFSESIINHSRSAHLFCFNGSPISIWYSETLSKSFSKYVHKYCSDQLHISPVILYYYCCYYIWSISKKT